VIGDSAPSVGGNVQNACPEIDGATISVEW
jgi:hypothetical protein